MPLTFIDIERQKNWRIWLFFLVLMLIYFLVTVLFGFFLFGIPVHTEPRFFLFTAVMAFFIAGIHFWFSASEAVTTVVKELNAQPPDKQDEIHAMLLNIIEEIHVVTGNKRTIECVVVPTLSLNALAVADLRGRAVVGITEGLLSRLTRPQLETVVAHEAHHILSGDCLETTVAASLFGTYASAIEKMTTASRGRTFGSPALLLAWVLLQFGYLLNMLISREREYRADAASVRMTRNPIALAETLHLLSRSWRGAGFIGSGYEMLCIVNPKAMALDETEGLWADLLSTHPPIRKRMDILLKMARVSIAELDEKARKKTAGESVQTAGPAYYAMNPQQQWQGPFVLAELSSLPWLSPLTWVTTGEQRPVERAWKQPDINAIFAVRLSQKEKEMSSYICPLCSQPLAIAHYEGTRIFQCGFCAGTLVENDKIPRIIARTGRGKPCSQRIDALARAVIQQNQVRYTEHLVRGGSTAVQRIDCPRCKNDMHRRFYSSAHLIEVDRCGLCNLTWFDHDELAMLQCLIEHRIMPEAGMPGMIAGI